MQTNRNQRKSAYDMPQVIVFKILVEQGFASSPFEIDGRNDITLDDFNITNPDGRFEGDE